MIYEYIPHKDPRQATGLLVICLSAAVGFFTFPAMFQDMPLRWLFQLTGVAFLAAVIFVYTRYIAKSFIYRVEEREDGAAFTVIEVTSNGRSRVAVCCFALSSIEEAHRLSLDDADKKKALGSKAKREGRRVFDFCPDASTPDVAYLFVEENGDRFLVKVATDQRLFSYFARED